MVLWSMEIMQFKVVDSVWSGEINTIYLVNNNWDDWFTYETVFDVVYFCLLYTSPSPRD